MTIKTFTPGQTYVTRWSGFVLAYRVIDRTPKTVTIQPIDDDTSRDRGEPRTRRVAVYDGHETIRPDASYAMAPYLKATDEAAYIVHPGPDARMRGAEPRGCATRDEADEWVGKWKGGKVVELVELGPALLTEADAIRVIAGRDDWTIPELVSLRARCDAFGQARVGVEMDRVNRLAMVEELGPDLFVPYGPEYHAGAEPVAVNDVPRGAQDALSRASARWGGAVEVGDEDRHDQGLDHHRPAPALHADVEPPNRPGRARGLPRSRACDGRGRATGPSGVAGHADRDAGDD